MNQGVGGMERRVCKGDVLQGKGLSFQVQFGARMALFPNVMVGSTDKKSFLWKYLGNRYQSARAHRGAESARQAKGAEIKENIRVVRETSLIQRLRSRLHVACPFLFLLMRGLG